MNLRCGTNQNQRINSTAIRALNLRSLQARVSGITSNPNSKVKDP
jgi:hypothetical protein